MPTKRKMPKAPPAGTYKARVRSVKRVRPEQVKVAFDVIEKQDANIDNRVGAALASPAYPRASFSYSPNHGVYRVRRGDTYHNELLSAEEFHTFSDFCRRFGFPITLMCE